MFSRLTLGRFLLILGLLVLVASGALIWAGLSFFKTEFPDVTILRSQFPVVHYQGKDKPAKITLSKSRPAGWVSLTDISTAAVGAVVVSEDWAFYQHDGFDAAQIKEAIRTDIERGSFSRGASTITQQVVRNVFLDKDKNLWRKLKELALAVRIEQAVGKRRILETYFNIAEWGEGIFGIRAAAQAYFSKSPTELTAKEGAFLAMLLPSPKRYGQSFRKKQLTAYARRTVESILYKMAQAHYITEEERDEELGVRLGFEDGAEEEATQAASEASEDEEESAEEGVQAGDDEGQESPAQVEAGQETST